MLHTRREEYGKQNRHSHHLKLDVDLVSGGAEDVLGYSYRTLVFVLHNGIRYASKRFFSVTTSKHINAFIRENEGNGEAVKLYSQGELNTIKRRGRLADSAEPIGEVVTVGWSYRGDW